MIPGSDGGLLGFGPIATARIGEGPTYLPPRRVGFGEVWWPRTLEETYWHIGKKKLELEEFNRREAIEEARLEKQERRYRLAAKKQAARAAREAFTAEQEEARRALLYDIRRLELYIDNFRQEEDEDILLLMSNYPL